MRRAKMMLKPKLGPTIKQSQPQQPQQPTPKVLENDAQVSSPSEVALMPPPLARTQPDSCEQVSSPTRAASLTTTSPRASTVEDSAKQAEPQMTEETTLAKVTTVSVYTGQKSRVVKPKAGKLSHESEVAAVLPARRERRPTKKADEFREMLMASRRRFGKVREPIDTSKLTMLDLIYYNPPGAPMKKKATEPEKVEKLEEQSLEPELEEESTTLDSPTSTKGTTDEEVMGPRVVVGPDGEIQIDETSLVIRRPNPLESKHKLKVTVEEAGKARYDSFKTKKMKKCTWTTKETSKFYRALSICGTDFTLMTQFFPSRSRQDLKNKFKREEKSNAALIDKAIHHPTQFEYTDIELEDIAKDDNEPAQKTKTPRSVGSKGTRKRKSNSTVSAETELVELIGKTPHEKTSTLQVSRPKRTRAQVDYSGMHEASQESEDASNPSREQEKITNDQHEGPHAVREEHRTVDAIETTEDSSNPAPLDDSPALKGTNDDCSGALRSPPGVIDEEANEQSQSHGDVIGNSNPVVDVLEKPQVKVSAGAKHHISSRKIPAPVFKPRHRKTGLQTGPTKKTCVPRGPLTVGLASATPVDEKIPSDQVEPQQATKELTSSNTASQTKCVGGEAREFPLESTTEKKIDSINASAEPVADDRKPTLDTLELPSLTSPSADMTATTATGAAVEAQIKEIFREDFEALKPTGEETMSVPPPKLVLPSRPLSRRIIRPIGAAKTRGVVLSPMIKRRSEATEQDN